MPPAGGAPRTTASGADLVFAALADATRRTVLHEVAARGEATATELAADMPVSRQAVVKHLGVLAAAGLVAARKQGREQRYRPTPAPLADALAWMATVGAQWDERLARLARLGEDHR
jgi:DNA-binding transcriptional ArsR family regulator